MARVLLVAPHAAFREPLAFLLGLEPGVAAVAPAASLAEARARLAAGFAPDLAVVELGPPGPESAAAVAAALAAAPAGRRVLVLG